jgi:hypothetical protein
VEEKGEPKPTTAPEPETEPASVSELASASEARASGPGPAPAPASGSASGVATGTDTPVAGPSAPKRIYSRKPTSTVSYQSEGGAASLDEGYEILMEGSQAYQWRGVHGVHICVCSRPVSVRGVNEY